MTAFCAVLSNQTISLFNGYDDATQPILNSFTSNDNAQNWTEITDINNPLDTENIWYNIWYNGQECATYSAESRFAYAVPYQLRVSDTELYTGEYLLIFDLWRNSYRNISSYSSDLPISSDYACLILLDESTLFVIGGSYQGGYLKITQTYDIALDLWGNISSFHTARYAHGCALVDQHIYIFGGRTLGTFGVDEIEEYSITNNEWILSNQTLVVARYLLKCQALNKFIFCGGGYWWDGSGHWPTLIEVFDTTQHLIKTSQYDLHLMDGRQFHGAVVVGPSIWWMGGSRLSIYLDSIDILTVNTTQLTQTPTKYPSITPSSNPTVGPTSIPTQMPTFIPTFHPSQIPTKSPTKHPTHYPTQMPTFQPTFHPTQIPTKSPTIDPTADSTDDPTVDPTTDPTYDPTFVPTFQPTKYPTQIPTKYPTQIPTKSPTKYPTQIPTFVPTFDPTSNPSKLPSQSPIVGTLPPSNPTVDPSANPSTHPTQIPTKSPTKYPTKYPTKSPTIQPTNYPTINPSYYPTTTPSINPTTDPTNDPTSNPTSNPSHPTSVPTLNPTITPTKQEQEGEVNTESTNDNINGDEDELDAKMSSFFEENMLIVIGAVIVFICFVVLLVVFCKKKKQKAYIHASEIELQSVSPSTETPKEMLTQNVTQENDQLTKKLSKNMVMDDLFGNNNALKMWLKNLSFEQYYDAFVEEGFNDQLLGLSEITDRDLIEMGVNKIGHRRAILKQIKIMNAPRIGTNIEMQRVVSITDDNNVDMNDYESGESDATDKEAMYYKTEGNVTKDNDIIDATATQNNDIDATATQNNESDEEDAMYAKPLTVTLTKKDVTTTKK